MNYILKGIMGVDKMKLNILTFYFEDGKAYKLSNTEKVFNIYEGDLFFRRWYRKNPYAKRLNPNCICCDYRIDQQRPQRNVYSEAYVFIKQMTEMEKKQINSLINSIEENIEYPTVWDDGETRHYEETIYCPNCGKRRKVLTSKSHCEHCGFEFSNALKCPHCNTLNLKGSKYCTKCGYEFRKESFITNEEYKVKKNKYDIEIIRCPKCNEKKSKYFDTCQNCGFDYSDKKRCPNCETWIDKKDKFCGECGQKLLVKVKCEECGNENNIENKYCNYCGNKL